MSNPLLILESFGQSVWLDYLSRDLIESGVLQQMIKEDGVSGVTSNPAIFEKAINGSTVYDKAIAILVKEGRDVAAIYQELTVRDVANAADQLYPVYTATEGTDGFVSLEVSPHFAHDSDATIQEARELWTLLDRVNVMIKVPATQAGLIAIRQLITEGINVNVTLLFGLSRYKEVCDAYLGGLERRLQMGQSIHSVASVASFFLSRIDSLVDSLLTQASNHEKALQYQGKIAIGSANLAYQHYQDIFSSQRFQLLVDHGARPQRLLWASTSTKNPAYSDTKYVESLIGANTINTMPMETLAAYSDHGQPAARLATQLGEAQSVMEGIHQVGINMDSIAQQLEEEGLQKFIDPYDKLFASLKQKTGKTLNE
tara:strand:- start:112950 stop:114062 length:1113 start_codon:yes stop_codon:yes gene_type:complete